MYEVKTKVTDIDVVDFLNNVEDDRKRNDCYELIVIMKGITGEFPKIWGDKIVGFGSYHYKTKSGCEADWPLTGFSPRKNDISVYIMPGFYDYQEIMDKLGKYKTGVSCLYIKKLSDIDKNLLKKLIASSLRDMKKMYHLK